LSHDTSTTIITAVRASRTGVLMRNLSAINRIGSQTGRNPDLIN
jgi:hypothetical protein